MKKKAARQAKTVRSKAMVVAPVERAFEEIVELIRAARQRAARAVNTALIELYWRIGDYLHRQIESDGWAKSTVVQLAAHIAQREPGLRGFSPQNLWRMRQFFVAYRDDPKLSSLVRVLPWTHNLIVLGQSKRPEEREFYLRMAAQEMWSSRELERQFRLGAFEREVLSPPNSMNKTFATFGKALKKDRYFESIQAHFLTLPSYRRFPADDEFRRDLHTRDLYNFRSRSYWLRRLENHGRKERVPVEDYSIEHILPQNPELSAAWQQALGAEWQRVQQQWLHTLGNLTLTGYNAECSDRPFAEKRDMEGGFKQSPLKLNAGLGQLDAWNEAAVQERAGRLADQALSVWTGPMLDAATLATYQPEKVLAPSGYTIADHPNLLTPGLREVFEAFRKEVLALDPCVSESFMKLYAAYKAETNFVDVVPQAQRLRLRLSINMTFAEVNDPKGLCKDVTNLGRWGNGDVEVGLRSLDELPYIMGLARQSYARQMGDGGQG